MYKVLLDMRGYRSSLPFQDEEEEDEDEDAEEEEEDQPKDEL